MTREEARKCLVDKKNKYDEMSKAIDVVLEALQQDIVRCGQCKYWKMNPNNSYGGYCKRMERCHIDAFCSYGERREDK